VLFYFTVRDDSIAAAIQGAEGKQVALTFDQHPGIPLSCFGDTEYFVTGVRAINPQPGYPGTSVTPAPPTLPVPVVPPSATTPVPVP